jgi:hypothetical protein
MLQPGGKLDLALKAVPVHARRHLGRKDLDDDAPPQRRLFRQEDATHSAPTELALDAVGGTDGRLEPRGQFSQSVRPGWEVQQI